MITISSAFWWCDFYNYAKTISIPFDVFLNSVLGEKAVSLP